jgi:succinyl-CoA synthetase alpha subunit
LSILVDGNTRLLVQGITGSEGTFHTRRCIDYGTRVVAGVTPGKGGTLWDSIPVFNGVERAVKETGANASMIFVPPAFAADAIMEAAEARLPLVVCVTEGIPILDTVVVQRYLHDKPTRLIGPNCPGLTSPGAKCKVGLMPGDIHTPGKVGVVSRSGTLTYESIAQLTELGIGQSTCVGIGGDPLPGTNFVDVLKLFEADPDTYGVVLIGEIGGIFEQEAAEYIEAEMTKPVIGIVVGVTAPPGRRMGHAGAIITGRAATAAAKMEALSGAGVVIAPSPSDIGATVKTVLESRRMAT